MVMVLEAHEADTPAGSPVGVPIPVAPEVVWVMAVRAVLIQRLGALDAAEADLLGVTVIVPVAFTLPHPPARGIA